MVTNFMFFCIFFCDQKIIVYTCTKILRVAFRYSVNCKLFILGYLGSKITNKIKSKFYTIIYYV